MAVLTWAQEQRVNWIGEMLSIYGYVNREHIMRKFRVSVPQASADMKLFKSMNPGSCTYDTKLKQYKKASE